MDRLLEPDEPAPVMIVPGHDPASPFLILCDHAGRRVPKRLGDLGLPPAEYERHIAWDVGALGVCDVLAPILGCTIIAQRYSRLVIDCNRFPGHVASIPEISERTTIPGNLALSPAQRLAREVEILHPYHAAITAELDRRQAAGLPTVFLAMHSFTPVYMDVARPWQAGVLHDRDPGFAIALGEAMRVETGLTIGDNEPYQLTDGSDYTVPHHAESRGLPYVELEIRQDLIADPAGQRWWGELLGRLLPGVYERYRR